MAYTAGDTILDDEYNNFVGKNTSPFGYNVFAGTTAAASANYDQGLGQTNISTVSAGNTITAAQWNSLWTAMDNIANHTNDTLSSTAAVSSGNTIAIKEALATDLATLSSSIANGCPNATALTTSAALQTVTTASEGWDTSATQEVSVTFTNANQMRWFFNAGGKVRITVGTTAAVVQGKDTAFADLGTAIGNLDIGSKATTRSGSGETLTTNGLALGFHDLTTAYQTILKLTSDNTNYTSNTVEIQAKLDAAVGTATVITVKMIATDPADDTQYTAGNTDGVAVAINDTPKMVTTLYTINPTTGEGLGTAYTPSTTATVSNTTL
jgi:hypothetical protein